MIRTMPVLLILLAACAGHGTGNENGAAEPGPDQPTGGGGWVELESGPDSTGEALSLSGTVRHLEIEGGVYVIEDAGGTRYTPMNLPDAFKQDGMAVEAAGRRRDDMVSVSMVGPMVELFRIRERRGEPSPPAPPAPVSLAGTKWLLEDLAGAGVIDDAQATLEFAENGRVSGSTTCNRFTGTATISGATISFGPLATTRRACAEALMNQERNYLAALAQAKEYEVQGSTLFLHLGGGSEPLRFTAQ
jgi:heat shock protein HslJ